MPLSFRASSILALTVAAAAVAPDARAQRAPCYVAFLHGSGPDLHDEGPGAGSRVESYFSPDGSPGASFTYQVGRQGQGARSCAVWRVGYDGGVAWWDVRAAGRAARALHDFIDAHAIPDGQLVIVAHSLGGLVARYVVNNGMPEAPYYNEYVARDPRMDYDLVRRKTALVVTVQTPHTGAQAADALYGQADHALTNEGLVLLTRFGVDRRSAANASMTRARLEAAGAPGGEMGDEGRAVPLYTVAGVGAGARSGREADDKLAAAWALLCYERAPLNAWGAACRWDFWNFTPTAGDGMIEANSAHGLWTRGGGAGGIAGARRAWLDVTLNHDQGRFNADAARIVDRLIGSETRGYLGTYLGAQGASLLAGAPALGAAGAAGPGPLVDRYRGASGRLTAAWPEAARPGSSADVVLAAGSTRTRREGDDLLVTASFTAAAPGSYWAYAELWADARPVAFARRHLGRLDAGAGVVTLRFGGGVLRDAGVTGGTSMVRHLRVARVDVHPPRPSAEAPPLVVLPPPTNEPRRTASLPMK